MASVATQLGSKPLFKGNAYQWESGTLSKDTVPWDLSAQVVTLNFFRPDGTTFAKSVTFSDLGVATPHVGDGTELDQVGLWMVAWFVAGYGWFDAVAFQVVEAPKVLQS